MNRVERREVERRQRKVEAELRQYFVKRQEKVLTDGRVEAMFLLFAEALIKILKLSPEECQPVLQYIEDQMPKWTSGEETLGSIRQRLIDEYGFAVDLGGDYGR